jgi:hypothetical protein
MGNAIPGHKGQGMVECEAGSPDEKAVVSAMA